MGDRLDPIFNPKSVAVIGELVRLVHAQNSGGLFGLLRGYAVPFAGLSLVAISARSKSRKAGPRAISAGPKGPALQMRGT